LSHLVGLLEGASMKKFGLVLLAVMLATVVGAVPSAMARPTAATKANTYRTYTACHTKATAAPAHRCPKKGTKGAFFKSKDAHVTYKVCVKFPSGKKLCASQQDAPQGKLLINSITSHKVGKHTVTWFVAGHKVGTDHFTIHS
jgi:curli biogenesis system outer membrane secretion channel CsgG